MVNIVQSAQDRYQKVYATLIDNSNNPYTAGGVNVENALDVTAYDINGASYSGTSAISNDFILESLELNFSSVQNKTVTVTSFDGTTIFQDTNSNTSLIVKLGKEFNASENFTVTVSQTSGACLMDLVARVSQGSSALFGNPVIGAGSNVIGFVNDFHMHVALGEISGHKVKSIYGRNPDIDIASGFETIWNGGGIYTGQNATGAEVVQVFSSSANDTAAGTGARTVKLMGLNGSGVEIEETITLNGTTAVDSVNTYWRMEKGVVLSAGSTGSNVGQITCRQKVSTSNIFFNMPATFNHTAVGAYTIPYGYTGLLSCYVIEVVSTTQNTEGKLMVRNPGEVWQVEDYTFANNSKNGGRQWIHYKDEVLPALTDIRVDGNSDKNNGVISCELCICLVSDS